MPLPVPTVARTLTHTRRLRFEAYKRADGLWDIEAQLTDIKPFDYQLSSGVRSAGTPVPDMWIRLTISRDFEIVDALALTEARPYAPQCAEATPDYRKLVGLTRGRGFRNRAAPLPRSGRLPPHQRGALAVPDRGDPGDGRR